ncbi:MAG: M48 family metallopeptidase [Thermoleophilaceae bacterium]
MEAPPVESFQLEQISPKAYEHPADRAATAALAGIPYLDQVVRKLVELGYERALRQAVLGSAVRLGEDQLPRVWALHHEAFHVLDVEPLPELYLTQFPIANAATIGAGRPFVVLNSELVTLLDNGALRAVLAHEAGHVLSDHVLYRTALIILLNATPLGGPLLALPLAAIRLALGEWFRASELTCDRAAALATRDPLAVCRTLMTLAAGAAATELDLDAFLRQASDFDEGGSGLEWLSRRGLELRGTHPLAVRRVRALMDWVHAGDYDRIVGGDYVRRGEEPSQREQASDAVDHYSERLKGVLHDAGEQLEAAGRQISDWLRGRSDKGPQPPDESPPNGSGEDPPAGG